MVKRNLKLCLDESNISSPTKLVQKIIINTFCCYSKFIMYIFQILFTFKLYTLCMKVVYAVIQYCVDILQELIWVTNISKKSSNKFRCENSFFLSRCHVIQNTEDYSKNLLKVATKSEIYKVFLNEWDDPCIVNYRHVLIISVITDPLFCYKLVLVS